MRDRGAIGHALRLFSDVRKGEAATALLLTLNVFILLTAYYLLKSAREPLILEGEGHHGAEVKSYASAGQAMILVVLGSAYGWLASHVSRIKLITIVTLFFVSNLVLFWLFGAHGYALGVPFYLWVGCYNIMVTAQFWSFAADIYTDEQGSRLFPIVGIGATTGAVFGAWIASLLSRHGVGPYLFMLGAAGLLVVALGITWLVHVRESDRVRRVSRDHSNEKIGGKNGWTVLVHDRYLLALGVLILVLNLVNSNGEYILDRTLTQVADTMARGDSAQYVQTFKATYFFWTNAVGVVIQSFIASRVIRHVGVKGALFVMPAISLVGYSVLSFIPIVRAALFVKVAENGIDYSLQNTAWQSLWIVVSRDAKYKTKQLTDGFIVRLGDVCSSVVVLLGTKVFMFDTRAFAMVNCGLVLVWLAVVVSIGRSPKNDERSTPRPSSVYCAPG